MLGGAVEGAVVAQAARGVVLRLAEAAVEGARPVALEAVVEGGVRARVQVVVVVAHSVGGRGCGGGYGGLRWREGVAG